MKTANIILVVVFLCFPFFAFSAANYSLGFYKASGQGTQITLSQPPSDKSLLEFRIGNNQFRIDPNQKKSFFVSNFLIPSGFSMSVIQSQNGQSTNKSFESLASSVRNPECYFAKAEFDIKCTQALIDESRKPFNVVFVFERTKFADKNALESMIKAFITLLSDKKDKVGMVSYGSWASPEMSLTNDFKPALSRISNPTNGYSGEIANLSDALKKAQALFGNVTGKKVIIVFGTGLANANENGACKETYPVSSNSCSKSSILQAQSANGKKIEVYSVQYNVSKLPNNAKAFAKSVFKSILYNGSNYLEYNSAVAYSDWLVNNFNQYISQSADKCSNIFAYLSFVKGVEYQGGSLISKDISWGNISDTYSSTYQTLRIDVPEFSIGKKAKIGMVLKTNSVKGPFIKSSKNLESYISINNLRRSLFLNIVNNEFEKCNKLEYVLNGNTSKNCGNGQQVVGSGILITCPKSEESGCKDVMAQYRIPTSFKISSIKKMFNGKQAGSVALKNNHEFDDKLGNMQPGDNYAYFIDNDFGKNNMESIFADFRAFEQENSQESFISVELKNPCLENGDSQF